MYLNFEQYDERNNCSNEITRILSQLEGKRILMHGNDIYDDLADEKIGNLIFNDEGILEHIILESDYERYYQDVIFMLGSQRLYYGTCYAEVTFAQSFDKFRDYLVMNSVDYANAVEGGYLLDLLTYNASCGVVIHVEQPIQVAYDYNTLQDFKENEIITRNGVIELIKTNTKPISRHNKKFTLESGGYQCVYDASFVENVGVIFTSVCNPCLKGTLMRDPEVKAGCEMSVF